MGNRQSDDKKGDDKKQYEKPSGDYNKSKKKQFRHGIDHTLEKLPEIFPNTKCNLRKLRLERLKDLLMIQLYNVERSEAVIKERATLDDQEDAFSQQRQIVEEMRGSYMQTGTLEEMVDDSHAIVTVNVGLKYYVNILSFVDRALLDPGCSVLIHARSHSVVGVLQGSTDPAVSVMKVDRAPLETYADVGGLDQQIQEVKEAVELPLTHPELFDDIGVAPPKGVIFYGPPGTGKTLLAKAVARETAATFLHMVGSELIQKYLGDGPKLVRELFKAAKEFAPSIVFIDEIDAVGSKRYTSNSGGTREVQRTMLELLNQLDGFDSRGDVKVIMATNRVESLDPALLRPGRIDRKIEFGLPDTATKRRIFGIHTAKMTLSTDVNLDEFAAAKGELSGADIKAICTEAGMLALRERRMQVNMEDFKKARETALYRKKSEVPEGLYL